MFTIKPPDRIARRWRLLLIDGSDVPLDWTVDVLRPDRTDVALHRRNGALYFPDPLVGGQLLLVEVLRPGGPEAGHIRHIRRIIVPEVVVPDPDQSSNPEAGMMPEGPYRIQAIPALDFGTYAKSAALWENRRRLSRGRLSPKQVDALQTTLGSTGELPADVERRSAFAYVDGDVEDRRHEAWDSIFRTPPLEHYSIRQLIEPVPLSLQDTDTNTDTGSGPHAAGADLATGAAGAGRLGTRGIKRDLLKKSPDPEAMNALVEAYYAMATEALTGLTDDYGNPRRPFQIQFTYPTRLPTAQRNRLVEHLRKTDLPWPRLGLDEATAVAFFDLLTRIGQRAELGIAALQAQAAARENRAMLTDRVLVIDVGAGTTDIALVDMRIEDVTPDRAREGKGRFWMLSPVVLASGGALTFGADGLTLDVFRAIKRRLRGQGVKVLNTAWRNAGEHAEHCWAEFLALWTAAEAAKVRALGPFTGSDVPVSVELAGGISELELPWADIATPTRSFLRRLAALAAGIAKAGLSVVTDRNNTDASRMPGVDRIVLSGQSFGSNYLRADLEKLLRVVFREDKHLNDDFTVVAHTRHLKSAAAFGAAFAASVEDTQRHPNHDEVVADLRAGLNRFGMTIDALRSNLVAEFRTSRIAATDEVKTIFERGTPLSMEFVPDVTESDVTESDGRDSVRRFIRSERQDVSATVTIERKDAADVRQLMVSDEQDVADSTIPWGSFQVAGWTEIRNHRRDLDDAMRRTFATYEIDENENIIMYVYVDALPLDLSSGVFVGKLRTADGSLDGALHLNAGNQLETLGQPLFPTGVALPAVRSISAATMTATLSLAAEQSDTDNDSLLKTWTIETQGHRWVSIDVDGVLRSHEFEPSIRAKDHDDTEETTLRMLKQASDPSMERWAYRIPLQPAGQYDLDTDPFSGVH